MKRILTILFLFLLTQSVNAAAPSRVNTYTPNAVISSTDVTENEDAVFNYLQAGVDTIKDGTITNDDINASANIQSDKLNLTSIGQAVLINSLGSFEVDGTATLDAAVLTAGTINNTTIGQTNPVAGKFTALEVTTTFKTGTANQGDIFYDNGTSIVRLVPGTSGQVLQTGGAAANPSWADSGFGTEETGKTANTVYAASSNGFVYLNYFMNAGTTATLYADTNADPTTERAVLGNGDSDDSGTVGLTCPIKSGENYKVITNGGTIQHYEFWPI